MSIVFYTSKTYTNTFVGVAKKKRLFGHKTISGTELDGWVYLDPELIQKSIITTCATRGEEGFFTKKNYHGDF